MSRLLAVCVLCAISVHTCTGQGAEADLSLPTADVEPTAKRVADVSVTDRSESAGQHMSRTGGSESAGQPVRESGVIRQKNRQDTRGHTASVRMPWKVGLRVTRPWSFTATVAPVALGSALAFKLDSKFDLVSLVLSLVVTIGVHSAGNLLNTLFDYINGFDSPSSSDTTLVNGVLSESQVWALIRRSYALSAVAAVPLALRSSAAPLQLLSLISAGAASAFVYTGGPGLKYKALGDVLITSTFGPLLVCFSYLVQSGRLTAAPILFSLPFASHIEAILHANNARDIDEDRANGVRTLSSIMGRRMSFLFYAALIIAPYSMALVHSCSDSLLSALPLLTAPMGAKLVADFGRGDLKRMPMRTAKFQFLFGMLGVVGVLLPSPPLLPVLRSLLQLAQKLAQRIQ